MKYGVELRKWLALYVAVIVALIGTQSKAEMIVNGDFETGDLSGWNATGNVVLHDTYGSYTAAFNRGDTTPNGVLSQSFSTRAGLEYELNFDFGVYTAHSQNQTLRVEVTGLVNLLSIAVSDSSFVSAGPLTFETYAFRFTADSPTTVLTFRDSASNYTWSTDNDIDNVRVNPVPEPSTYAMALAGLACAAWQMFRRCRRACSTAA